MDRVPGHSFTALFYLVFNCCLLVNLRIVNVFCVFCECARVFTHCIERSARPLTVVRPHYGARLCIDMSARVSLFSGISNFHALPSAITNRLFLVFIVGPEKAHLFTTL